MTQGVDESVDLRQGPGIDRFCRGTAGPRSLVPGEPPRGAEVKSRVKELAVTVLQR